jgi:diaminopimelate epimerase
VNIPFVKAHGARNDFLLTWRHQLPPNAGDPAELAKAICERNTGVGADGWIILTDPAAGAFDDAPNAHAAIELWNSDGSRSEISGNGTRCAAALAVAQGKATEETIVIATGAGPKTLRLLARTGNLFSFEMDMGRAAIEEIQSKLIPGYSAVILNVGNPQLAVLVTDFDFDWRKMGAQLERHPHFPNRTNVSFVRVVDDHTLDVRFFERGAGETMSSGTGSTGAAAAAIARGLAHSPVRILTPAGPLDIRQVDDSLLLAGPAELCVSGDFYYDRN